MTDVLLPADRAMLDLLAKLARGQVKGRDGLWVCVSHGEDGAPTISEANDTLNAYEAERLARFPLKPSAPVPR